MTKIFSVPCLGTEAYTPSLTWFRYVDNGAKGTSASFSIVYDNSCYEASLFVYTTIAGQGVLVDSYGDQGNTNITEGTITHDSRGFGLYAGVSRNGSVETSPIGSFDENWDSIDGGTNEWMTCGTMPANGETVDVLTLPNRGTESIAVGAISYK